MKCLRKSTDDRPAATGANRRRWIWSRHASICQDPLRSRRPVCLRNVGLRCGDGDRARRGLNQSPIWCGSLYLSFHRQHRRPTSLPSAVQTVKWRRATRLRPSPPLCWRPIVYAQRQWTVPGCGCHQPPGHRRASLSTEAEWQQASSIRRLTVSYLNENFNLNINLNFSQDVNNFRIRGITQTKLQKSPKLLLNSYNLFLNRYVNL